MKRPTFGIMVCQIKHHLFHEKGFYKLLQLEGLKHDIDVYVFYPNQIDWVNRRIRGFQYDFQSNLWKRDWFPLPQYIYDRCFYTSSSQYLFYKPYVQRIRKETTISFLGNGLNGKWEVYQILSTSSSLQPFIPKTEQYQNFTQLSNWLQQFPVVLKPIGGSHGIGVIRISKQNNHYEILGRDQKNKTTFLKFQHEKQLRTWLLHHIANRRYLIQQYLELTTHDHHPYDIRVLIQKNQDGHWETTGMAARIGEAMNITSNLHGGGTVKDVPTLLEKEFGLQKKQKIIKEIDHLSSVLPTFIEKAHGPLFEVGLDIGVDKQGHIWIIEINSKPGRNVFALLGDTERRKKSLTLPILYAKHLYKNRNVGGNVG